MKGAEVVEVDHTEMDSADSEDSDDGGGVDVITLDDDDDENETKKVTKNDEGNKALPASQPSSVSESDSSESESGEDDDETNDEGSSGSPIKSKPVVDTDEPEDSSSDSDSESELELEEFNDEVDVITLDDEDDDEKEVDSSKPMICYRCPAQKVGVFSDRAMFLFHVKRHLLGENFSCPTCKRPFIKLSFCVAHEIMVHGTEIPLNCYSKDDPVISAAKEFVEKSKQSAAISSGQPSTSQGNNDNAQAHSSSGTLKTDDDALSGGNDDGEDPIDFNNDHIVTSTSYLAYRGPPVTHMLECYELQLNHARRKNSRANNIAKIAINFHKRNVEQGFDEYRLGRFAKQNNRTKKLPKSQQVPCELLWTTTSATTEDSSDLEVIKEPQKKQAQTIEKCITSSIPSTSSSKRPAKPPPPVFAEVDNGDNDLSDLFIPKPRSPNRKRKRENDSRQLTDLPTSEPPRSSLSTLVQRVCRQCDYIWTTADDLYQHRGKMHPNVTLLDLLPFPEADPSLRSREYSSLVKKKKVTFSEIYHESTRQQNEGVARNVAIKSSSNKAQGKKMKLRSILYRTPAPVPDSSFTEKERFLFDMGLSNVFRLHLHLKKPLKQLKMPACTVDLEKMDQLEFTYYFAKYSRMTSHSDSEMFTGFHFLLGF